MQPTPPTPQPGSAASRSGIRRASHQVGSAAVARPDGRAAQRLSSPRTGWIGAAVVQHFLRELLDDSGLRVEHPGGQIWTVRGNRSGVLATSTWGTARYPAPQLAQALLEQRRIEVRDKGGDDSWVLNMDETLAAQEKAAELAARFSEWAWEDPARATDLAARYNETLNNLVLRQVLAFADDLRATAPGRRRRRSRPGPARGAVQQAAAGGRITGQVRQARMRKVPS